MESQSEKELEKTAQADDAGECAHESTRNWAGYRGGDDHIIVRTICEKCGKILDEKLKALDSGN